MTHTRLFCNGNRLRIVVSLLEKLRFSGFKNDFIIFTSIVLLPLNNMFH
jgi:hypothetical protein